MSHSYQKNTGQMGLVGQPRYDWVIVVPHHFFDVGHMGQCWQKCKRCKAMYIAPLEIPAGVMEFAFANGVKKNHMFNQHQAPLKIGVLRKK